MITSQDTAAPFDIYAVDVTPEELDRPAATLLADAAEAERNAQDNEAEADRWRTVLAREERVMGHLEGARRRAHRKATRKDRPNTHHVGREELRVITERDIPRQQALIDQANEAITHHTRDAARLRAVAGIYRTAAAQTAPAPQEPAMPAPTVSLTLPEAFCTAMDMTPLVENELTEGDDDAALLIAYAAARPVRKITTSNPAVLDCLAYHADMIAESNQDDATWNDDAAREMDAAQTTAQRARTALRELRTALDTHKAQQAPQEPATAAAPAQDDTPAPRDITAPVGTRVTATLRGQQYTGTVQTAGPLRAATTAHARQGIRTHRVGIRVPGRDSLLWADSHQTTPATDRSAPAALIAARLLDGLTVTHQDRPGTHRVTGHTITPAGTITLIFADGTTAPLAATAVTAADRATFADRVKAHQTA